MSLMHESSIEKIVNNEQIVIFGAGIISKYYVEKYNIDVKYFVDNDCKKWNTEYMGKRVKNPQYILEDKENIIIFICSQYILEISEQLSKMGFKENVNYYNPQYLKEKDMLENSGVYQKQYNKLNIMLDMSGIIENDKKTGIQRVVKNIVRASYSQNKYEILVTRRLVNSLVEPSEWLQKNDLKVNKTNCINNKIEYSNGDVFVLLDTIWNNYDKYKNAIDNIRNCKGKVISIIYDIIPLKEPEKCTEFYVKYFKIMFLDILERCDGLIAISKYVADDVISYINNNNIKVRDNFKIGWFHMGVSKRNFEITKVNYKIEEIIRKKTFIMVGTVEPRKDHKTVIDAFEKLWNENIDVSLCIVGKIGWKVEKLIDRIRSHSEFNHRLFFLEQPTDSELGYCYNNAEALIFASVEEGFGLPLIEAASYKLPLIISDIPIFKEIAEDNAIYFKCEDSYDLKNKIQDYFNLKEKNLLPKSEKIKINTWEDSLNDMINIIVEDNWYKEF